MLRKSLEAKPIKTQNFEVLSKTVSQHTETSFIIRLKQTRRKKFTSGDLLAIHPANDHRERLYSVGKIGNDLQLSIKLHEGGLGSGFLFALERGQTIKAAIVRNSHFHFPKKAKSVIMVSNGTGIAPFLGMIAQYGRTADIHLYCGFKNQQSFALYENALQEESTLLTRLNVAYSREGNKAYVKDLLLKDSALVCETLKIDGVIMLCGSLSMQKDVIALLEDLCQDNHQKSISFYQSRGQILMDCY